MAQHLRMAITLGDPAGVGPEIVAKSLNEIKDEVVFLMATKRTFYEL